MPRVVTPREFGKPLGMYSHGTLAAAGERLVAAGQGRAGAQGRGESRDADRSPVEERPMNAWEILRPQLNVAAHFVDRNVAEGGGAARAHLSEDGTLTYADVQALTTRAGNARLELGVDMRTAS